MGVEPDVESTPVLAEQAIAAPPHQDYVAAIRQVSHDLFEGLDVTLINTSGRNRWKMPAGRS